MTTRVNGFASGAAAVFATLALAACSSPPARFYTLSPADAARAARTAACASAGWPSGIRPITASVPESITSIVPSPAGLRQAPSI